MLNLIYEEYEEFQMENKSIFPCYSLGMRIKRQESEQTSASTARQLIYIAILTRSTDSYNRYLVSKYIIMTIVIL